MRETFTAPVHKDNGRYFRKCAKWSKWLMVFAGLMGLGWGVASAFSGDHLVADMRLGLFVVFSILLVASLILGLIALCGIAEYGGEGILKPAAWGVFVSLIGLVVLGKIFFHTFLDPSPLPVRAREPGANIIQK